LRDLQIHSYCSATRDQTHSPPIKKKSKTPIPENIRTADHTWMILNQMPHFQHFFRGYLILWNLEKIDSILAAQAQARILQTELTLYPIMTADRLHAKFGIDKLIISFL